MAEFGDIFADFARNLIAFLVMIVLAVIGFFFTIFVVDFGAALANRNPSADFAVLSAAVLVGASIVAGGGSAIGYMGQPVSQETEGEGRS